LEINESEENSPPCNGALAVVGSLCGASCPAPAMLQSLHAMLSREVAGATFSSVKLRLGKALTKHCVRQKDQERAVEALQLPRGDEALAGRTQEWQRCNGITKEKCKDFVKDLCLNI